MEFTANVNSMSTFDEGLEQFVPKFIILPVIDKTRFYKYK